MDSNLLLEDCANMCEECGTMKKKFNQVKSLVREAKCQLEEMKSNMDPLLTDRDSLLREVSNLELKIAEIAVNWTTGFEIDTTALEGRVDALKIELETRVKEELELHEMVKEGLEKEEKDLKARLAALELENADEKKGKMEWFFEAAVATVSSVCTAALIGAVGSIAGKGKGKRKGSGREQKRNVHASIMFSV